MVQGVCWFPAASTKLKETASPLTFATTTPATCCTGSTYPTLIKGSWVAGGGQLLPLQPTANFRTLSKSAYDCAVLSPVVRTMKEPGRMKRLKCP